MEISGFNLPLSVYAFLAEIRVELRGYCVVRGRAAAEAVCKLRRAGSAPEGRKARRRPSAALFALSAFAFLFFPLSICFAQRIPKRELQFFTQPYVPPAATLVRRVSLVEINAVARNVNGHVVANLRRRDFKVFDNGKLQTITQFHAEFAAPAPAASSPSSPSAAPVAATSAQAAPARFIALFFDDRSMPFGDLSFVRKAAETLVREDVRPGERVGVFTASGTVALNFTTDRAKILRAIQSVRFESMKPILPPISPCTHWQLSPYTSYLLVDRGDEEIAQLYTCSRSNPSAQGGIGPVNAPFPPPTKDQLLGMAREVLGFSEVLSRSVLGNLDSVIAGMAHLPGQRVVVLISSGFFTESMGPDLDAEASEALRDNVVIDSLDAKGLVAPEAGTDADLSPFAPPASPFETLLRREQNAELDDVMANLARDTGGTFFHNSNDLAGGLRELTAAPEVSYLLGFSPSGLKDNGAFHHLKVKVTAPDVAHVQARRGYYAPVAAKKGKGKGDKLDREVLAKNEIHDFPVEVASKPGRLPSGNTGMEISLHVDPQSLSFLDRHGQRLDQVSLVVALFNGSGAFVTGEQGLVEMALSKKSLEHLTRRGLNATVVLQAPEGNYRLRAVIEEVRSGKIFAASRPADIP